jgi:branched-chain amino acid transport system substrate-binding protein
MKKLAIIFLGLFTLSCATLQPVVEKKPSVTEPATKPPRMNDQDAGAIVLFKKVQEYYSNHQPRDAAETAQELLIKFPGSSYVPEAVFISAKSRYDLGQIDLAIKNCLVYEEKYFQANEYPLVKKLLGDCYFASQDYMKSGQQYIEGLDAVKNGDDRESLLLPLSALIEERLAAGQLKYLYGKYPNSEMAPALGLKLAQKELEVKNTGEAVKILNEIEKKYPYSREAVLAQQALSTIKENKTVSSAAINGLKVGLLVPLNGRYSEYGASVRDGVNMAFVEYNKTSSNKVKLLVEDSRGDIIDAIKSTCKLCDTSEVIGIIGEVLSGPTSAAAGIANVKGVPFLSPTASEERISSIGPYVFQLSQSISWQGTAIAECAVKKLGMKIMGVLYPNEPGWTAVAEAFANQAKILGANVSVMVSYEPGATDFKAQAVSLKAGKVQAVFIPANPSDIVMIAPQLVYNQLKVQLLGTDGWGDAKVISKGGPCVEGALFATLSSGSTLAQATTKFEESFKKIYGKSPSKLSAQAYDGAKMMLSALNKGAVTREEVKTNLSQVESSREGVSGQFVFGRTDAVPKYKIMAIRNKAVKELE